MKQLFVLTSLGVLAALATAGPRAAGGQEVSDLLPSDPAAWINSPPLSAETLKGKGVVLWFYEEQCPNCRAKWPGLVDHRAMVEFDVMAFVPHAPAPPDHTS